MTREKVGKKSKKKRGRKRSAKINKSRAETEEREGEERLKNEGWLGEQMRGVDGLTQMKRVVR